MINWSTDEKSFKENHPNEYKLWRLTQLINYGLDGERLSSSQIKKVWPIIKYRLDPYKARYLEFLIWGKVYSLPNNLSFWNLQQKTQV